MQPSSRYYDVGDNLQMMCKVTFDNHTSQYIDVNTNALIKWRKSTKILITYDNIMPNTIENSLVYESTYTLFNVALSDATLYTCEAIVSSDVPGVEDSNITTSAIDITVVGIISAIYRFCNTFLI